MNDLGKIYEKKLNKKFRKKHGIFYSPNYITNYILKNSLSLKFKEISKSLESLKKTAFFEKYFFYLKQIKILDPACGAGVFLLEAFDFFKKEYLKIPLEIRKNFDIEKNILQNNLFGVDLNMESVEITKFGLLLKTATQKHTIAILENNIKCGNSLIDDIKIAKEKAFNWNKEFPKIMKNGGFDIIVGNPPYVVTKKQKHYEKFEWNRDLYMMFFEQCLLNLLKKNSFLSFITPRYYLVNKRDLSFRKYLLKNVNLISLTETNPFDDAVTENIITILQNTSLQNSHIIVFKDKLKKFVFKNKLNKSFFFKNEHNEIQTFLNKDIISILEKIEFSSEKLKNYTSSKRGMEIGKNKLRLVEKGKRCLIGQDVKRYRILFEDIFVEISCKEFKRMQEFFNSPDIIYLRRVDKQLTAAVSKEKFAFNKNIYGIVPNKKINKFYLLLLLNSKLLDYFYKNKFSLKKVKIFPEIQTYLFELLPIKIISLEKQKPFILKSELMISLNKEKNEEIKDFLETLKEEKNIFLKTGKNLRNFWKFNFSQLKDELQKQKIKFSIGKENKEWRNYFLKTSNKIINLENEISNLNEKIDKMVYKIYKLTKSEIEFLKNFNE